MNLNPDQNWVAPGYSKELEEALNEYWIIYSTSHSNSWRSMHWNVVWFVLFVLFFFFFLYFFSNLLPSLSLSVLFFFFSSLCSCSCSCSSSLLDWIGIGFRRIGSDRTSSYLIASQRSCVIYLRACSTVTSTKGSAVEDEGNSIYYFLLIIYLSSVTGGCNGS